ncbi:DUF6644 family protein [Noviherbaspirillum sp. Root189]|uniref:DUF6644 family protein n=1 Tax=Noviherbaspirillum sp. Root189 TaxID=1736487 RepID=UPI00070B6438|nr:DUF6644 family protein [Noviherbaspirillum sp. Root189]KRB85185.1 hypothetical protein ASE07_20990 [Noviherbaspirillum sp. Root189]
MQTTAIGGALGWLETSVLGAAMRGSLWMYPIVEIFHIIGFSVLVGSIVMFDLRILGLSKDIPVTAMARHFVRWSLLSLLFVIPAGIMMFTAHPGDFIANKIFLLKLTLIGLAGINAVLFHLGVYRHVANWNALVTAPKLARAQAMLSLVIWIAVISCGRLLAYT